MNINSPDFYKDASAEDSLEVTQDFIDHVCKLDPQHNLVTPILTPRFAVACDANVLSGLGKIAKANPYLPIQTHFDETEQEMEITKQMHPGFDNEADLYEHYGLLTERTILAHCIYVDEYEMGRLKTLGCGVAHCPVSVSRFSFTSPLLKRLVANPVRLREHDHRRLQHRSYP